jgi:hypothetical protein
MELTMKNIAIALAAAAILSLAACSRRDEGAPPASVPTPAADTERLTLAERLMREAGSRPAGALRAEEVATALERAGLALRPMKQVLARTVGARFCMSTQTGAGLGVAVCEFADDADAARGLDYSRRTFDHLIPNRRLARNHRTVLTLTRAQPTPALDDQAARAVQAFASL